MKTSTLVIVFLICVSHSPAPLLAQERPPIIDMHMHTGLPPHDVPAGTPALCRPEPCRGEGPATASHAETLAKTLEAMNRYNIVRAFSQRRRSGDRPGMDSGGSWSFYRIAFHSGSRSTRPKDAQAGI